MQKKTFYETNVIKRVRSVKRMDDRVAIPWSQQVDEDLYDNPSYSSKNKSELANKLHQSFERIDLMRNDNNNTEENLNLPNVSCNTKKSNNYSFKMSWDEPQKAHFDEKSSENYRRAHSPLDKSLSMPNESNFNKKKITWASIASQPAKPNKRNILPLKKKGPGMPPPPMIPGKHSLNANHWDHARKLHSPEASGTLPNFIPTNENAIPAEDGLGGIWKQKTPEQQPSFSRKQPNAYYNKNLKNGKSYNSSGEFVVDRKLVPKSNEEQNLNLKQGSLSSNFSYKESFESESSTKISGADPNILLNSECSQPNMPDCSEIVLKELQDRNNYNPSEMDMQTAALSRYFVIKSYSEDDIHRSIKYEIWCSTDHGNKRLDESFKERMKEGGNVMLFFSVNGSGHFCGMAQMMTPVDYKSTASVWSQDKWKGKFKVKWIYVKDVPNSQLRHIRLENNENKSVTNSRDTQEIPLSQGLQMLKILHLYKHLTSIFDDFYHYEKKQEESVSKRPAQFDNHVHSVYSSNDCSSDTREQNNDWHFKEKAMFHRGEHSSVPRNRRYGKAFEAMEPKKRTDGQDKSTACISQDPQNNEANEHIHEKYSHPSIDSCASSITMQNNDDKVRECAYEINN